MSVLDDYETWKDFLANRLEQAEEYGMSEGMIQQLAQEIGDYLAHNVEPTNKEVAAIQELWHAASPDEQQAIANSMIKLVQNQQS